jgi:DNA-binding NarL/FixJ family response regulator
MIKIAIVDDQKFVQEALDVYVRAEARETITITGVATSVEALTQSGIQPPDVVLLDVRLGNGTRLGENVRRLREWGCAVVVISQDSLSPELRWVALDGGALGFLHKDEGLATIRAAIESAAAGDPFITPQLAKFLLMARLGLTQRQEEVAAFIAAGMTNSEIAKQLYISEDVVKEHVRKIKERYQRAGRPVGPREDLKEKLRQDGYYDR